MPEQIDLLDSAPRFVVGMGGARIGKTLRTLKEAGVVSINWVDGQMKVETTHGGKVFLAGLRGLRGRI